MMVALKFIKAYFLMLSLGSVIGLFFGLIASTLLEDKEVILATRAVLPYQYRASNNRYDTDSTASYQGVLNQSSSTHIADERNLISNGHQSVNSTSHSTFIGRGWTRLEDFIQVGPPLNYKMNTWSHSIQTTDINTCVNRCRGQSSVTLFKVSTEECLCEDYFSMAYPAIANPSIDDVTQIAVNYNLSGLLSQRIPSCKCEDPVCDTLSCAYISCWVGPTISDLIRFVRFTPGLCEGGKLFTVKLYTSRKNLAIRNHVIRQVLRLKNLDRLGFNYHNQIKRANKHLIPHLPSLCIPESELRGFWPLHDTVCSNYRREGSTRIYRITSPDNAPVPVRLKPKDDQIKILISAHWRSGSTLTSELFASHPDNVYIFEPLQYVQGNRYLYNKTNHDRITERALYDVFNCNLHTLPSSTFNKFVQATVMKAECDVKKIPFLDCLASVITRCVNAKLLTVKTIRAKLKVLESLTASMPNIKNLVVLRDPRAIHSSRLQFVDQAYARRIKDITNICKDQLEDMVAYKELSSRYKGQLSVVHYEDIIFNSTAVVHRVYKDLSLGEPPRSVVSSLYDLTHGSPTKTIINGKVISSYSTFQKDSIKAAFQWKKKLDFSFIQEVDKYCADSYRYTGYRAVRSIAELHDPDNYHRVSSLSDSS